MNNVKKEEMEHKKSFSVASKLIEQWTNKNTFSFTSRNIKGRAINFENHMLTLISGPLTINFNDLIEIEVNIIPEKLNRISLSSKSDDRCSLWLDVDTEEQARGLGAFIHKFNDNYTPDIDKQDV